MEQLIKLQEILTNPAYSHLKRSRDRLENLLTKAYVRGELKDGDWYVDVQSLSNYFEFKSNINKNYCSLFTFIKLLNMRGMNQNQLEKALLTKPLNDFFETIEDKYTNKLYIKRHDVDNFINNYVRTANLRNELDLNWTVFETLCKKHNIETIKIGKRFKFIKICDVTIIRNSCINSNEYYTYLQAQEVLNLTQFTLKKLIKERNIHVSVYKEICYVRKTDIDSLKVEQSECRSKYCSQNEALEILQITKDYTLLKTKPIKKSILFTPFYPKVKYLYEREKIEEIKQSRLLRKELAVVRGSTPFETFKYQVEILNLSFANESKQTERMWFDYVYQQLINARANEYSIDRYVSYYVKCSSYLIELINGQEIYSVTSKQINSLINKLSYSSSRIIYQFLKEVNRKLKEYNLHAFNMSKIENPYEREFEPKEKTIYQYSEYKILFDYTNDINLHKQKAIDDVLQRLSGNYSTHYASAWLYILIHLNNAWRNNDVMLFPRINLDTTSVISLEWLLHNDISENEARIIVNQITKKDFRISKNGVRGHFFCSDEILISLATAACICELRTRILYPQSKSIIHFETETPSISQKAYNAFFKQLNTETKFKNLKLCRSVMSYIHTILASKTSGSVALDSAKFIRGHKSEESTNIYIRIPDDEFQFLTYQLFCRGHFGDVKELFTQLLFGKNPITAERTNQLMHIKNKFGDVHKIEATAGFLNQIQEEQRLVSDMIRGMTFQEASDYMHKIDTHQLPSKEEHVQCLVIHSQGCIRETSDFPCRYCPYAIPNFYALSALGASIKDSLQTFEFHYYKDASSFNTKKAANILFMELKLLYEAIDEFGKEVVFDFIDDSPEIFEEQLNSLPSLKEILNLEGEK